jgi:hypothetical protein
MQMIKKFTGIIFTLLFLAAIIPNSLFSDDYEIQQIKKKLPKMLGANNVGKEFWFSIPPCYEVGGGDPFIKIFVTTPAKTVLSVEIPGKGYSVQKVSVPNDVVEFNITPSVGQPYMFVPNKVPPAEKVYRGYAIHVFSDQPLVVYCVVRYYATSDGFLAFPASSLGKEYISCSYGDMGAMYNGTYPSELTIVSPHDNNVVKFTLGGNIITKTAGGMTTGQTDTKVLNKGDVWAFSTYGYEGDLTGSKTVASKPVGVVSGNFCTNIPTTNRWCDYTVEMDIPTFTWGLNYHVAKIQNRKYASLMRIFAKEKNTKIYRDNVAISSLPDAGGLINKGWVEMRIVPMGQSPSSAVISGDKPIGVTLCNTGVQEDGYPLPNSDPFLMGITPMEQYQKEITFATPGINGGFNFKENYLNLVYALDESGYMPEDLEFASVSGGEFNWEKLKIKFAGSDEMFKYDVNGKKYAVKTITLPNDGVYKIRAEKPFAAYSYGYDWCDSYGFPTSAALMDLEKPDTVAPVPSWEVRCDGSTIWAKVRDLPEDATIRSNLAMVVFDSEESFNYKFDYDDFIPGQQQEITWSLVVLDVRKDAKAVITFSDRRGNDTTIIINYYAVKLSMEPQLLDWGTMKLGEEVTKQFKVKNLSTQSSITITRLPLRDGAQNFELTDVTLPFVLNANEEKTFNVKFKAVAEGTFKDSIGLGDTCVFAYWTELVAYVGEPIIEVSDINFGSLTVGKKATKTFTIKNLGTVDLRITGYNGNFLSVYTHDLRKITDQNPLIIPIGAEAVQVNVDFKPVVEGTFLDSIVFLSDAGTKIDNVAMIQGIGIKPGLIANSYDWGKVRIHRATHPKGPYGNNWVPGEPQAVLLENNGSEEVRIGKVDVNVIKGDKAAFIYNESDFTVVLLPGEKKLVDVKFQPTSVGEHEIELLFNSTAGTDVRSNLKGIGLLPKAVTEDMDFGLTLVNDLSNIQQRKIKITNVDYPWADTLTITNLIAQPNSSVISSDLINFGTEGFRYDRVTALTNKPGGKIVLLPGEFVELDAEFVGIRDGSHAASLVTVSDAEQEVTTNWKGEGRIQNLTVVGDQTTICSGTSDILDVTISNTGSYDIVVDNVSFKTILTEFSFVNPNDASGFTLKPGESKTINIRFQPNSKGTYSTELVFKNDTKDKSDISGVITGTAQYYERNTLLLPASQTRTIGEVATIAVNLKDGERIDFANLQVIDVEIKYDREFLKPGIIRAGNALNNPALYKVNTPVIDESQGTIFVKIEALGTANFDVSGDLLLIDFMTYLPTGTNSTAQISHTISTLTNECVKILTEAGATIALNPVCVGNLMHVRKLFGTNSINLIKPNPAGADGANIEFTTALDNWTEIRVYNANGELVALPISDNLKAGEYSFRLDTKDLPSGSYTIQFTTGNHVETRSLNIVK